MTRIAGTLIALTVVVLVVHAALTVADGVLPGRTVAQNGEDYFYEVSWTWFKLGIIHLQTLANGKAEAHIDSYPNVPFVDLHSIHYSRMDSLMYSHGSSSIEKKDDYWEGLDYAYDLPARKLFVEEIKTKSPGDTVYKRTVKDTLNLPSPEFVDGLSIAYFPRRYVHTTDTLHVPTVLYGKLGTTTFNFSGRHTAESIDVLDDPVKVVEFTGNTTAVGIYGMTGDFTGWFSDDSAAVPIKGKLKVLIGSVTVELVKWNRSGWRPPQ
jgi:hypothetical protein